MDNPRTVDECMQALAEMFSCERQAEFTKLSRDDLIMYHHGLGQWIRNNWGLWKGGELKEHMSSLGFMHPDDMSQAIIEEYWIRLNNLPSEITRNAQASKEYWAKKDNQ